MDFYKLDKIDKIVISIVFIFGALFSILNNFVFASEQEDVSLSVANKLGFDSSLSSVISVSSGGIKYFEIEPGYIYHIINSSSYDHTLAFSDDIPDVGIPIFNSHVISGNSTYSFYSSSVGYIYADIFDDWAISATREKSPSYNEAIFSLSDNVSGQLIWESIESAMPFILVCIVFGLGFVFIHRLIKSGSKGKAKLF